MDGAGLVDAEPVLRHFGGTKRRAVEVYGQFVDAGIGQRRREEYYRAVEGRLLGSEEFLKEVAHRVGDHRSRPVAAMKLTIDDLLNAAERMSGLSREELCTNS